MTASGEKGSRGPSVSRYPAADGHPDMPRSELVAHPGQLTMIEIKHGVVGTIDRFTMWHSGEVVAEVRHSHETGWIVETPDGSCYRYTSRPLAIDRCVSLAHALDEHAARDVATHRDAPSVKHPATSPNGQLRSGLPRDRLAD